MEPLNTRLYDVLQDRIDRRDLEDLIVAVMWIARDRPTLVVRALDYAAAVRAAVDETLAQRPPEA